MQKRSKRLTSLGIVEFAEHVYFDVAGDLQLVSKAFQNLWRARVRRHYRSLVLYFGIGSIGEEKYGGIEGFLHFRFSGYFGEVLAFHGSRRLQSKDAFAGENGDYRTVF